MEPGGGLLLAAVAAVSFVLAFLGAAVGLVLGHLRLPLLIAYLGGPGSAAVTNLLISGCGAFGGTARHIVTGRTRWKVVLLMGVPSVVGAVAAMRFSAQLPAQWSFILIGAVLMASGILMLRSPPSASPADPLPGWRRVVVEVTCGLALGALAAVTGLMLGSLRLPVMLRYLKMDVKDAVGTNLAVGFLTAAVGGVSALAFGTATLNGTVVAVVMPATALGGFLGGWLTGRVSKGVVRRAAGAVVAATGAILFGQGLDLACRRPTAVSPPLIYEEGGDHEPDFELPEWEAEAAE